MSMNLHLKSKRNDSMKFKELWQAPTFPFYTTYSCLMEEDMVNGNCIDRVLWNMYWHWCWDKLNKGIREAAIFNHLVEINKFIEGCGGIDECDFYFM